MEKIIEKVPVTSEETKKALDLIEKMNEMQIGAGYTIAQWLVENDLNNITLIADPRFPKLVKASVLSIKNNIQVCVNNWFSSDGSHYVMRYSVQEFFLREIFDGLDYNKIEKDETVIYIAPERSLSIRRKVEERGAKFFTIGEIYNNAIHYIEKQEPLLRMVTDNPDIKVLIVNKPTILNDTTEYGIRILKEKHLGDYNRQGIKEGDLSSPLLSDAMKAHTRFSLEDWHEVFINDPISYHDINGSLRFIDEQGKLKNIINGNRITVHQTGDYENTIHMVSGCTVFGPYHADDETWSSYLQKMLNGHDKGKKYRVENHAYFMHGKWAEFAGILTRMRPKSGDIVVFITPFQFRPKDEMFMQFDLRSVALPTDRGMLWYDATGNGHNTPVCDEFRAEELFKFLVQHDFLSKDKRNHVYKTKQAPLNRMLRPMDTNKRKGLFSNAAYAKQLKTLKEKYSKLKAVAAVGAKIGCLTLSGEAFDTKEEYLINEALKSVDHLYVFVNEKDEYKIPFSNRFDLIEKSLKKHKNLTVLPSGTVKVDNVTFLLNSYKKDYRQKHEIDVCMDLDLFAKEFAPILGINTRFALKALKNTNAWRYNLAMENILPEYGIEFVIV